MRKVLSRPWPFCQSGWLPCSRFCGRRSEKLKVNDALILFCHGRLFAMVSGSFVSFCKGLTTKYNGIDVFIARPALGYIKPQFQYLDFREGEDSYRIGGRMHDVVDVFIEGLDQEVQVLRDHYSYRYIQPLPSSPLWISLILYGAAMGMMERTWHDESCLNSTLIYRGCVSMTTNT